MYYLHGDINGAPCDFSAPWSECVETRLAFPSVGTDRPFFAHDTWVNYETTFEIVPASAARPAFSRSVSIFVE